MSAERPAPAPGGGQDVDLSLSPMLVPILGQYGGRRGRQLLIAAAAAQSAAPFAKWALKRWQGRGGGAYTVTVRGEDVVYQELHAWILERMPERDRRALIAETEVEYGPDGPGSERARVTLSYDGDRQQVVDVGGHKVLAQVQREGIPSGITLSENWKRATEKIKLTAADAAGRDAVIAMLREIAASKVDSDRVPALHVPAPWGREWRKRGDLPARGLDSVVLKVGQLERLRDDLARFLDAEGEYARYSQPWHRGYLFHGEPGTGKTSLARALAHDAGLPTYYLPLGDLKKDADLMQLVGAIKPRSMLLLEDVDSFHAATDRTDQAERTSVAAMLNSLDGVWTPHGMVTVMTTNNREALDPALIRAGRVDVDEEFTALDQDQAERLAAFIRDGLELSPSQVLQLVGQSPAEAMEALRDFGPKTFGVQGNGGGQESRAAVEAVVAAAHDGLAAEGHASR